MNIEQLAKNLVLGSYPANDEVAELIKWAYDRRHVEPNEANFHRLIASTCNLTKKQEGYVMGAYRESFAMLPRENLPGNSAPVYPVYIPGVIPGNFTSHRASWRKGLEVAHNLAATTPDQQAYWAHEIAAYDRSFDRLLGTDSFTPPASLTAAMNVGIPASQAQWPAPGTGRTFAGYSDPLDIENKVQAQPRGPQPDNAHIQPHELWKDGDEFTPASICDSNRRIVLALCKRCGKGESELVEPCTPPAAAPLSDDDQAALKMPADAGAVLGVLSGHNGELFDATPANLDRLLPRYDPFEGQAVKHDGGDFYSRADVLRLFGNIV